MTIETLALEYAKARFALLRCGQALRDCRCGLKESPDPSVGFNGQGYCRNEFAEDFDSWCEQCTAERHIFLSRPALRKQHQSAWRKLRRHLLKVATA